MLAIDGGSSSGTSGSVASRHQPAARSDGGPDESRVAASLSKSSRAQPAHPDESKIAAAISGRR